MSTMYQKKIKVTSTYTTVNIERYDSAMEVVQHCRTRKKTHKSFKNEATRERTEDWDGVNSYEEALTYLRDGYQPTVEKLKEQMKATKRASQGSEKRISFRNEVAGFQPIIPLALMGVPNAMVNTYMKPIKCKVVDIYYDMSCTCGTSSDTIIRNGQKLLGAVMSLEKQGYKFNLYACQTYCSWDKDSIDMLIVKIKSSDKPLDLKRISFPLTHTAFFRVIGFDWYSKTPHGTYRSGYGTSVRNIFSAKERAEFAKQTLGSNALYIKGEEIQSDAEEHIKEVLTSNERNDK